MQFEKRDKKAYLVYSDFDSLEPRIISSYYLIDIDPTILPDNLTVYKLGNAYITDVNYRTFALPIPEFPTFTEFTPVKPPRKTGYVWKWGRWVKGY